MPKKPVKRGYKIWRRAYKFGYIYDFQIYTGKEGRKCSGARLRRKGGTRFV